MNSLVWRADLNYDGCRYRIDGRQEIGYQVPAITTITTGKELAGVSADVDATGVLRVSTHTMAQDAQANTLACWQSFCKWFPAFAAILGTIHTEMLTHILATILVLDYNEHGIGMMSIDGYRKSKFRGQGPLDVYPIITCIQGFVDAAVVLLVQDIRLRWVLDEAVNALAELWVLIRQKTCSCILIGKDPVLTTIICAHAAHG